MKNVVSHITDFSLGGIMSLESVAHLIRRFISRLEVKQTPDKAVAPSQSVLHLDDVFNYLPNGAQAISILSHDGKFGSHPKLYKSTTTFL